jgi:hypothetical protein
MQLEPVPLEPARRAAAPMLPPAVQARQAPAEPRPGARRSTAHPMTAPAEPRAPRSWARPKTTPLRARSTKAQGAPPAESWQRAIPSRSTPSWGPGRQARRNPTTGPGQRQRARIQRGETPTLARAAALLQPVVAAGAAGAVGVAARPAEAQGPWARRGEAPPKPAPAALPSHPSSALLAVQRTVRAAAAAASRAAAGAGRPRSARRDRVPLQELPRSGPQRAVAEVGRRRSAHHPTREQDRHQGLAATQEQASPSSARFREAPRQLEQLDSARALHREAPRWSQSLPDETPRRSVVGMAGARAARSVLACDAYA